jgi:hypothetical protein
MKHLIERPYAMAALHARQVPRECFSAPPTKPRPGQPSSPLRWDLTSRHGAIPCVVPR